MFEYCHAPAPQLDDVLDELREAREMVAHLTRANEALTEQVDFLTRANVTLNMEVLGREALDMLEADRAEKERRAEVVKHLKSKISAIERDEQ